MLPQWILFILILFPVTIYSIYRKKLTYAGGLTGALIATIIFSGGGITGILLLAVFFIVGVGVTAWNRKNFYRISANEPEKRDALQVMANAGMAGLLGITAAAMPDYEAVLVLMMACAFASATADTVSSELGIVYGKKFYDILTFSKGIRGADGVISAEGTVMGIIGSLIIAIAYSFSHFDPGSIAIIVIAGTLGNLTDSFLGATLERKNIIGNNAVNFINTFVAAAIGGVLSF